MFYIHYLFDINSPYLSVWRWSCMRYTRADDVASGFDEAKRWSRG